MDVSVLTPSFGYARFISDAIRSVALQESPKVEHVIQDGASTDGTTDVLDRYGSLGWVSEPDTGQSQALNRALARAGGRWIAWLNADEFYLPGALARLVEEGDRSGADLVYGDAVFCDEHGRFLRGLPQHRFSPFVLQHYGSYISSCAMIVRREALEERPFDESLGVVMDHDLYLSLAANGGRIRYLAGEVGVFRVHDERVTSGPEDDYRDEREKLAARYGFSTGSLSRFAGRGLHRLLKLTSGAYLRQMSSRRRRGADLRWFEEAAHPRADVTP